MESLHMRLRRLRKSKGLTLKAVSKKVGVAQSTYRDWEYGAAIQGEPYLRIAEAMGVSVYEVLGVAPPDKERLVDLIQKLDSLSAEIKKELSPPI